jgi:hypothetical protein
LQIKIILKVKTDKKSLHALPILTTSVLNDLIKHGFQYVHVRPITFDNKTDYLEPNALLLVPIKELPTDLCNTEVYSPVNSSILNDWASSPNEGVKVLVGSEAWL